MSCCCPHCDLNEDKTIIGIFIPVRNSIKMYHWAHLNYTLMHLLVNRESRDTKAEGSGVTGD